MSRIEVTQDYRGQYDDPIEFRAGELVTVGKEDPEYCGWYWCRSQQGKQGWVHHSYLATTQAASTAARDYSARELTVTAGATAELLERVDGWLRVRLDDGIIGWLPESHVKTIVRTR